MNRQTMLILSKCAHLRVYKLYGFDWGSFMRWGVEQRLEFVDFRLFWEGWINRSHITDRFDVSVPQASKDLSLYEEKAPGNLVYDKSAKRYVASAGFQPKFIKPNAD